MLDVLLPVIGCLLVALVVADVFTTVLWSGQGAGPLTAAITSGARRALPPLAGSSRRLHSAIGPVALAAVVLAWASLLLVGFTLLLEIDPDALRTSVDRRPSDLSGRAYFVGYTLFTLGNGDLVPTTDLLRAITVVMNTLGMFLITLSVTYLLPVISASVGSRSFASSVSSLGDDPAEAVAAAWDGRRVRLDHQLRDLASQLSTLAHQHLAYPVLHLFHSADLSASAPLAVARVDDMLLVLEAVDPSVAPAVPARRQLRSSIRSYVDTYGPRPTGEGRPPQLSLAPLEQAGVPLRLDQPGFDHLLAERDEHRRRVHDLAEASGVEGR